jgi:ribose/xylose/arabinose/galactoside ABC-type transport system permease subunit
MNTQRGVSQELRWTPTLPTSIGRTLLRYVRIGGLFIVLLLFSLVMTFASPYFLTARNVLNILVQAATLSIVACGETIVMIEGEIDLSIGSNEALTGAFAATLLIVMGLPAILGILMALVLGLGIGLINGFVFVKGKIPSFIVTLAMLGIAQGAALLLTAGRPISGFPPTYTWLGQGSIGPIATPVVIAALVYIVFHLLLTRTRFGLWIYAVGGGRRASEFAGIRTDRILISGFAISGLLSAIAGIVMTARLDAAHGLFGQYDILDAVAAVVIGGTSMLGGVGTVVGTLVGVLMISTIRNGLVLLNVQAFWQQIVVGVIIIIAVLFDQLGKRQPK